jgi:hypothetical protein
VPIHPLPFRIGRRPGLDLTLPSELVSKEHAEIYSEGDGLRLRDLRSTNGTFVNRDRIQDVAVREGDILHFAQFEFRLGQQVPEASLQDGEEEPSTVVLGNVELTHQFVEGTRQLTELLEQGAVRPFLQPIVALPEGILTGYEVLGRGLHPGLPENPADLFRIAASMGLEAQLSRLFRQKAIETVRHRTDLPPLFLNTHPAELAEPGLFKSLVELQASAPHQKLTLEIHEGALADPTSIAGLRSELAGLGIGLAYDDFGAGQARLLELAEVPPHFLKFDMRFI